MRVFRGVWMFVMWTALGAAGIVVLALVAGVPLGYHSLTVMSGSMEPAVHVGDVVVVKQVPPLSTHVGDIVTFRDPDDPMRLLTHRVRSIRVQGTDVGFVTKGDANTGTERWSVNTEGTIGVVELKIPSVGFALVWTRTPMARILLLIIPALALGAYELRRIWSSPTEEVSDEPA